MLENINTENNKFFMIKNIFTFDINPAHRSLINEIIIAGLIIK